RPIGARPSPPDEAVRASAMARACLRPVLLLAICRYAFKVSSAKLCRGHRPRGGQSTETAQPACRCAKKRCAFPAKAGPHRLQRAVEVEKRRITTERVVIDPRRLGI